MPANSYGIIVEGDYDAAVYRAVIGRLASHDVYVKALSCGGRTNLMRKFPGLLRALEREIDGSPVDMAVVIRDADGKNPEEVEAQMQATIQGRQYPFRLGVHLHAVRNALESWLLADPNAISAVVQKRTGRRVTRSRSNDAPEDRLDAKETFRKLLIEHGVSSTPLVYSEIAHEIKRDVLLQACPRFRLFSELVDC